MFEGTDWTVVLVAAITGLTALIGLLPSLIVNFSEARRVRKSVRASLLAEVGAVYHFIQDSDCIERLAAELELLRSRMEALRAKWEADQRSRMMMKLDLASAELKFTISIPPQYNQVYQDNIGRLGVLRSEEAAQIVLFYQLIQSVLLETSADGFLAKGTTKVREVSSTLQKLRKAQNLALKLKIDA